MEGMALRADDGTLLQLKEAVVLDKNGEPIAGDFSDFGGRASSYSSGVRFIQTQGWLSPILLVFSVIVAVSLGAVFLGVLCGVFLLLGMVRLVRKLMG
jgi:hypothetical protein